MRNVPLLYFSKIKLNLLPSPYPTRLVRVSVLVIMRLTLLYTRFLLVWGGLRISGNSPLSFKSTPVTANVLIKHQMISLKMNSLVAYLPSLYKSILPSLVAFVSWVKPFKAINESFLFRLKYLPKVMMGNGGKISNSTLNQECFLVA